MTISQLKGVVDVDRPVVVTLKYGLQSGLGLFLQVSLAVTVRLVGVAVVEVR